MASGHGLATKVGLDGLLTSGILGDDVQELLCCARGLAAERVDKSLTGHAVDEGIDHVSVGDVRELIAFLREALNVLPEGLINPLVVVVEFLGVPRAGVGTVEVADEDRT